MSPLSHIIAFGFLFFIFFCLTKVKQTILSKRMGRIFLVLILLYSIIVGTRWDWGLDYGWYKERFEHPFRYADEDFGWGMLNIWIGKLGLNYVGAYIIYSLIFIGGGIILIRSYRENKYMPFLFVLVTMGFSTLAIRQAFAHSFVFLAISALNYNCRRKWLYITACIVTILSIHPAALITLLLALTSYFFCYLIPLRVALPSYLFVCVCSNMLAQYIASRFPDYIQLIPLFETKFVSYAERSESWFGEEGLNEERIQSTSAFILTTIYYCCFIYLSSISLKYKYNAKVAYVYNVVLIGIMLLRFFILFEILRRIVDPLECLIFIPLGYALYFWYHYRMMMTKKERVYAKWAVRGIWLYLILYYGRFLFLRPDAGFVWS